MIEAVEKRVLHACDLCKRRIPSTSIKTCLICGKELCQYCRIKLTRIKRKYPDSGYTVIQEGLGNICINCSNKKIKTKLKPSLYA